jgi:peptidoglycan/xylan/chitin deacetylase (PgdA/CDA1 family)
MAFFKHPFTILYAHQVSENPVSYYPDNFIEVDEFRKQLRWFKKRFNVISLSEARDRNEKFDDLRNCLTLTFDDGFRSNYELIAPILTEEKLPAAFFINNDSLDNQSFMWRTALLYLQNRVENQQLHHALNRIKNTDKKINLRKLSNLWAMNEKENRLEKLWNGCNLPPINEVLQRLKPYVTSQQIQAIHQAGFEIGGHTFSHPFCNQLTFSELKTEILDANNHLRKKLDLPIEHFSYPFGNRPNENLEKRIIDNSDLKTVLGISYNLHNQENPHNWNRIKMESTLNKTKRMIGIHHFLGK